MGGGDDKVSISILYQQLTPLWLGFAMCDRACTGNLKSSSQCAAGKSTALVLMTPWEQSAAVSPVDGSDNVSTFQSQIRVNVVSVHKIAQRQSKSGTNKNTRRMHTVKGCAGSSDDTGF